MAALEVPVELWTHLQAMATEVFKPRGSILFRRGDEVSGVFLLRSGRVKLGLGCDENAYPSRILGAGGLAGLPATMSGARYSLTAEVMEDSRVAFVPREAVLELLKKNSYLSFQVMQLLSEEISGMRSTLKGDLASSKGGRAKV